MNTAFALKNKTKVERSVDKMFQLPAERKKIHKRKSFKIYFPDKFLKKIKCGKQKKPRT